MKNALFITGQILLTIVCVPICVVGMLIVLPFMSAKDFR